MRKRIMSLVLTLAVMLLVSGLGGYDSCVYAASKPGAFTVSASNFTTNDDVVINWSSASGADHYGLSVWKPPYGGDWDLVFDQSVSGASQNIGKLPAGKYRVQMAAYNNAGSTTSNLMFFYVTVPAAPAVKVVTYAPALPTSLQNNPTLYVRIKNRWTGKYLHEENKTGLVQYGDIQSGWLSAQWSIENKDGFVRIKNRWTGDYMNIESNKGSVQLSAIKDGWQSASWTMENVEGYTCFKNQWKQTYINTERKTGSAECNKIATTAWSSQWTLEKVSENKANAVPVIKHVIQQWVTGNNPYYDPSVWGKYHTISSSACGVAAASMALSSLGIDKTPIEICDKNVALGHRGDYMACWNDLGVNYKTYITLNSTKDIEEPLENYKRDPNKYSPPITYLVPAHFVVVTGETDTYYTIYDPGFPEDNRHLPKPAIYTQVGQFSK